MAKDRKSKVGAFIRKSDLPSSQETDKTVSDVTGQYAEQQSPPPKVEQKKDAAKTPEKDLERFTTYIEPEQKKLLKLIATLEERNIYDIYAEGLNMVFEKYKAKYPDFLK